MNVAPSCTPSVQGTALLPRMCTAAGWRVRYFSCRLCTQPGKSRSTLYTRFTTRTNPHGNAPLGSEHSATNGIFVHMLYGPVQLNGSGPCTYHTGSVHILRTLVAPCTLGICLRTTLMAIHHSPLNTLLSREFSYPRCTDLYS